MASSLENRNMLAYFTDESRANNAKIALENAHYKNITITPMTNTPNDKHKNYTSIVAKVYGSNYGIATNPLLAAGPLVSGLSYDMESSMKYNYILILPVNNHNFTTAQEIIRENGGRI